VGRVFFVGFFYDFVYFFVFLVFGFFLWGWCGWLVVFCVVFRI